MKETRITTQTSNDDGRGLNSVVTSESDLDQSFHQLGRPGDYRVMKGIAPIDRQDLTVNATLAGLVNFIAVRKDNILDRANEAHIKVSTGEKSVSLTIGEFNGYREEGGSYVPQTVIYGSSAFTDDQKTVKVIMSGKHSPHELAMKLRDLPHLFADEASWKEAVSTLRSLSLKVSKAVKDTSNEDTGEREKAVKLVIESGAVAVEWNWKYAIYEGTDPVTVPVKVLYEADESMSGVYASVFNPRKVLQERKALEDMLANTVTEIRKVLGNAIPIIEVNK